MTSVSAKYVNKTLLGWKLTSFQDVLVNYLIPSICACFLYIFIIACDVAVVFRHYKDGQHLWAHLTITFMFLPAIGSYLLIITDIDLWPEEVFQTRANFKWFILKFVQHALFPIWNMWRYAERIFWSIEAIRCKDENERDEAKKNVYVARNIELYVFLQAYLHALPQILLQLHILMRLEKSVSRQTVDALILSFAFNLAKVAVTTTYYQRFKTQKLAGKQYPWFKRDKKQIKDQLDGDVVLRRQPLMTSHRDNLEDRYNIEPSVVQQRRRSSDIYLEPVVSMDARQSLTQRIDNLFKRLPSSIVTSRTISSIQPDFNISRIRYTKGLPEDDLAGKLIAFLWWYNFILARILALASFAYFYAIKDTLYLVCAHVGIVLAFLIYDVKQNNVKRSKLMFFLFIGYVYVFCIIEFKIKFKKSTLIYYGYFGLVYFENFIICLIWYNTEIETLENDFWFRFVFFVIVVSSIFSFSSMLFYFFVNKPKKIVVAAETVQN